MNVICSLLASAIGGEITSLIETSGLVAKAVLVILLIFSLASWAIIFGKWGLFRRARAQERAHQQDGAELRAASALPAKVGPVWR